MGKNRLSRLFGKTPADDFPETDGMQRSNDGVAAEASSEGGGGSFGGRKESFEEAIMLLSERIEAMEREMADVKGRVHDVQTRLEELSSGSPCDDNTTAGALREDAPKDRTIYLSAPSREGVFADFSDREQIGKSIYSLDTHDGKTGQFAVLTTDDATATAAISISQFIKPVCKIENAIDSTPSRIMTTSCGEAFFNGEAWVMSRKATVRLEK